MGNNINLKTLIALRRTVNNVSKYESKAIKEAGITMAQFAVLEALYHKGDLTISEILEKTLSTSGNMTVVIENLQKADLVYKCQKQNDKRCSIIRITEKGRNTIGEIFPSHTKHIDEAFSSLDTGDKEQLLRLLKKLNNR